ncbi:hypothetical protein [Paenibacillus sp.]|uniref:hypothetical protein n=1 Tax=Paenibacillus sp. TaxID=58172 RepID=UPI002D6DD2A3|nr:hypothetical protein [Paenibacillus sp.]HZG56649.1 hypothetical protein [Paenibacillus sp.]
MTLTGIDYRAGDILTACDNELNVPTGYLGHSAIVVDEEHIVEAVITYPYVQVGRVADFLRVHPKHAQYRPVDPAWGQAAARYAVWYVQQSDRNKASGVNVPPFSFSDAIPLQDPWTSIYCSKLVWLCYYYGVGYPFYNDFYLFSPEDLDAVLSKDPNFRLVYKHPEFQFFVNT